MGKFDGIFIASDMDGTLLDDTHAIQRETIDRKSVGRERVC